MRLWVIAVGQRMPHWAQEAFEDFHKRFPPDWKVTLKTVKTQAREGDASAKLMAQEAERLRQALPPGACVVALDERGRAYTTQALSKAIQAWSLEHADIAFVIGGPDGLDAAFKLEARHLMRLSDLTLPHALARVLLMEQLYRAWSIQSAHPYHRE
jgi:23S rRNA (pseudouridine1915-N3)-methyltransferase